VIGSHLVVEDSHPVTEPLSSSLSQFPWVCKRDGRLVPFDADKISRSLFAATEALGQPDPFLARELTDAAVQFLGAQADGSVPTTTQIAERVARVVRDLGHPRLAQEYAACRSVPDARLVNAVPDAEQTGAAEALFTAVRRGIEAGLEASQLNGLLNRTCLRSFSLHSVFSRDLVAAHHDGLLTLGHLHAPLELTGCVLPPGPDPAAERGPGGLIEWILEARNHVGDFLALDSPEYTLVDGTDIPVLAAQLVRELRLGLAAAGLRAVVNLNAVQPPAWASDTVEGPLFAAERLAPEPGQLARCADALLEALLPVENVRIDWHLSERDFAPQAAARLTRLARYAAERGSLAFVFDRPRRPWVLAEGLDRQHPAVLLTVGLNLARLAAHPRLGRDLLNKVGSVVRLALSAASQKREFLRRHSHGRPELTRGFLVQRARMVLVPIGLDAAARHLHGQGLCDGGPALAFARQVIQRLRETLRQDGAAHSLYTCLDAPASFRLEDMDNLTAPEGVAGLTPWDVAAPPRQQIRSASTLHEVAEMGTAAVLLSAEEVPATEELVELLHDAWHNTEVVRLRFVRVLPAVKQLTAPWET
jgi:hypothetical protein